RIEKIILKNPYNLADYQKGKMSILDIKAQDQKGSWYNIEMQIGEDLNFDKRAIYYWSKMVTEKLSEGMMFKHLNKTISINILDFNIIESNSNYHNLYRMLNEETGKDDDMPDMFELHFIELKKFRKHYNEIANTLDRWITFLTRANKLDKQNLPKELSSDSEIVKAIEEVDRMFDEEEREMYNVRLQQQMEFESKLDSATEKGRKVGMEEGIKKEKTGIAKKIT
ncbi:MAG: transposase, partial [Bacteroidetes bacterium]